MPIDYKNYPSNWKTEIRPAILQRAKNKCEWCGLPNYAVGVRNEGFFIPASGGELREKAGKGLLDYKQAATIANAMRMNGQKAIVIVLTVAHLDHDTQNNDYDNLRALCQQCHNRYDVEFRKKNRNINKERK